MSDSPIHSPISSLPNRTATDSLVSVPLSPSDDLRLSVTNLGAVTDASPAAGQDEEDEEYMASLLARLEMENDALATDPKNAAARSVSVYAPSIAPSIASSRAPPQSLHIPAEALGMSLGDFWTFVTRNYQEALAAMPTMTPVMIRKGIPDFLRPVVWCSLADARDLNLYSEFQLLLERLEVEHSSIDGIIDKDLGRCFPNHDLFMHPSGEGQRMLGQVLKCYSLHDPEIGYCQGMGFVVGILLMKMEVQDAFCVFVRLMENHGLRNCYSKSLSGLHLRIYQFQQFLAPLAPNLLAHFQYLGVEFAYLSQWFMTIFATTCPLDTLFRIYDVVLAEGAEETIMKVALALILKNEQKLLEMNELEDVLQLLLGRSIWDPYEGNTDQLIEEVTTLFGQIVTKTTLENLSNESGNITSEKTVRALGFGGSAFRIFDSLWWAPSKSTSLSPTGAVRRTTSKQSLSTLNSIGLGSGADSLASTDSYASTAPTEVERDIATPTKPHRSVRQEDRNLHEQVEGLLMALSEVQREAAQTAADLQKEQEKRNKAQEIVSDLVKLFHQKKTVDAYTHRRRTTMPTRINLEQSDAERKEFRRRSNFVKSVTKSILSGTSLTLSDDAGLQESLLKLCAVFDEEQSLIQGNGAVSKDSATSTPPKEADPQVLRLEEELVKLRRRMLRERARGHSRRTAELKEARRSSDKTKSSAEPVRIRRDLYRRKDKIRNTSTASLPSPGPTTITVPRVRPHQSLQPSPPSPQHSIASQTSTISQNTTPRRQRMIKTQDGRETPAPQRFSKRTSSLVSRNILATADHETPPDETLLVELVNAKTREATAIQERDEMKAALDKARRWHETREQEMQGQLESVHAIMAAQMQAHNAELDRLKLFYATSPITPSGFTQSPLGTPSESTAQNNAKGWGWFGKGSGRSVSTSGASVS